MTKERSDVPQAAAALTLVYILDVSRCTDTVTAPNFWSAWLIHTLKVMKSNDDKRGEDTLFSDRKNQIILIVIKMKFRIILVFMFDFVIIIAETAFCASESVSAFRHKNPPAT